MKKDKLTYFVSKSKDAGFHYELTAQRGNGNRELCNRWPNEEQMRDAIGLGTIKAIQAKQDYGNPNVSLVVELEICSIVDPMIKL